MPTYEYVCTECSEPLEVVQSIHDPALTQCPACGGRLRKVFGNVGVVFKGSGFYRTDSRGKTSGAAPAAAKASGTPGGSSSEPSGAGSTSGGDSASSTSSTGSTTQGSGSSAPSSSSSSSTASPSS